MNIFAAITLMLGFSLNLWATAMLQGEDEYLEFNADWPELPEDGKLINCQKCRVGDRGLTFTIVAPSNLPYFHPTGDRKQYEPLLVPDELCANACIVGRVDGSYWFSTNNLYHKDELIFVGDGFRRILELEVGKDYNRGPVILSKHSELPDGVPACKGIVVTPKSEFNAWPSGGFLHEVRETPGKAGEFEARIDFWDVLVHSLGSTKVDREMILRTGDEFTVTYSLKGPRQVIYGTATGVVRCVGVYAAIPEKKFRGGVGLVPVSHTFQKN